MSYEPKIGQYLFAPCSQQDVYEIVGVGKDDNDAATIDVRVIDLNEVLHFENDNLGWRDPLTRAELPAGVSVIFRGMQWRQTTSGSGGQIWIVVNSPKGGCYRCVSLFSVRASPGGKDPVVA